MTSNGGAPTQTKTFEDLPLASIPEDNLYHPSFMPILTRVRERGFRSPWAYVVYEPPNRHSHAIMLGDGEMNVYVQEGIDSVEVAAQDAGEQLAEAILLCSRDRHDGHGRKHSQFDAEMAFKAAFHQLVTKEFDRERAHTVWLRQMYDKWGGHIPAAVLVPDETDFEKWNMIVPDHRGDPEVRPLRKDAIEIPPPTPDIAEKSEVGWRTLQAPHGG